MYGDSLVTITERSSVSTIPSPHLRQCTDRHLHTQTIFCGFVSYILIYTRASCAGSATKELTLGIVHKGDSIYCKIIIDVIYCNQ